MPIKVRVKPTISRAMTSKVNVTFGELESNLKRWGFEVIPSQGRHKVYVQKSSGAMLLLPPYREGDVVRPSHLAAVKKIVSEKADVGRRVI